MTDAWHVPSWWQPELQIADSKAPMALKNKQTNRVSEALRESKTVSPEDLLGLGMKASQFRACMQSWGTGVQITQLM